MLSLPDTFVNMKRKKSDFKNKLKISGDCWGLE